MWTSLIGFFVGEKGCRVGDTAFLVGFGFATSLTGICVRTMGFRAGGTGFRVGATGRGLGKSFKGLCVGVTGFRVGVTGFFVGGLLEVVVGLCCAIGRCVGRDTGAGRVTTRPAGFEGVASQADD